MENRFELAEDLSNLLVQDLWEPIKLTRTYNLDDLIKYLSCKYNTVHFFKRTPFYTTHFFDSLDAMYDLVKDTTAQYSFNLQHQPICNQGYSRPYVAIELTRDKLIKIYNQLYNELIEDYDLYAIKGYWGYYRDNFYQNITENGYTSNKGSITFLKDGSDFDFDAKQEVVKYYLTIFKGNAVCFSKNSFEAKVAKDCVKISKNCVNFDFRNNTQIVRRKSKILNNLDIYRSFTLDIDRKDTWTLNIILKLNPSRIIESIKGYHVSWDLYNNAYKTSTEAFIFSRMHKLFKYLLNADNINGFTQYFNLPCGKKLDESWKILGEYKVLYIGQYLTSLDLKELYRRFYPFYNQIFECNKTYTPVKEITRSINDIKKWLHRDFQSDVIDEGKRNEYFLNATRYGWRAGLSKEEVWEAVVLPSLKGGSSKDFKQLGSNKCEKMFYAAWKNWDNKAIFRKSDKQLNKEYDSLLELVEKKIFKNKFFTSISEDCRSLLVKLLYNAVHYNYGKTVPIYSEWIKKKFGNKYKLLLNELEALGLISVDNTYMFVPGIKGKGKCKTAKLCIEFLQNCDNVFKKYLEEWIKMIDGVESSNLIDGGKRYKFFSYELLEKSGGSLIRGWDYSAMIVADAA